MCGVTRMTSLRNDGDLEEVHYFSGDHEIALEIYDRDGALLQRTGVIPDGVVREMDRSGRLRRILTFRDNGAHGRSVEYYLTGEVREENSFLAGRLDGMTRMYRRDGTLWIEGEYRNGKPHGVFTSFHDNGNIETRSEYRDGVLHGPCKRWDRHGMPMEEAVFSGGKRHGDRRLYHDTGEVARVQRYRRGRLLYEELYDEAGNAVAKADAMGETLEEEGP